MRAALTLLTHAAAPLAWLLPLLWVAGAAASTAGLDRVREHLHLARYEEAEMHARALLVRQPGQADAWYLLGESLAARGRDQAAAEAFDEALVRGASQPLSVRAARATIERRAGDAEAAEAQWRAIMRAWRAGDARDAAALMAVAAAARGLGQGDPSLRRTALRLYEEAMRRAPEDPAPRVALADLLLESYNNEEAQPLYQEALSLDPKDPAALLGMARSLHFDNADSAAEVARAALELAPDSVPARVFLARVLADDDRPELAREQLEAALAVNPRALPALSLLAALHDADGEDDRATSLMDFVLTISPGYAEGYVTLAELAADRRRYADAVRFATRAVALDSRSWRAHRLLGMNRLRLGYQASARESLEAAFRGDPFNVWTKNTLELLDAMDGYTTIARGRFVLVAREDHARALAPYIFPIAEAAYAAHAARYGVTPAVPVRIEVHPEHDDLSVRTLGVVGVDLLGVSFGPTVVLDAPMVNPSGPANWASVLWHELAHTFQLALSIGRAPRWLAEGMAVHDEHLARPGWGQDVGPGFLQTYVEGKLARASALNDSFLNPEGPEALGHAYLQAGLLVALIERDHGAEALRDLLAGYARGERTQALLMQVLGQSPQAFDAAFDAYMHERFGDALEALTPPPGEGAVSPYAALMRSGLEALEAGDMGTARAALLQARNLVPGHVGPSGPHRALVRAYQGVDDALGVIASVQALVDVDADDLDAHLVLAGALEERGDGRRAARILERALLIQPFDAGLHERLAVLLEAAGDWPGARRERAAVVALGAVDPVQARYRLALASSRIGDLESARGEILQALENAPLFEPGLMLLLDVRERLAAAKAEEKNR